MLCDTWPRCLEKLQFMLTETCQISNLRNQDVSKEILSNLVRKDIAKFSDKFSFSQYATLEMFKAALNNYSMLKLFFLINTLTFTCLVKTSPISIMQLIRTPNHIFYCRFALNRARPIFIFFIWNNFFYCAAFFHFPYEISNDII